MDHCSGVADSEMQGKEKKLKGITGQEEKYCEKITKPECSTLGKQLRKKFQDQYLLTRGEGARPGKSLAWGEIQEEVELLEGGGQKRIKIIGKAVYFDL